MAVAVTGELLVWVALEETVYLVAEEAAQPLLLLVVLVAEVVLQVVVRGQVKLALLEVKVSLVLAEALQTVVQGEAQVYLQLVAQVLEPQVDPAVQVEAVEALAQLLLEQVVADVFCFSIRR